MTLPRRVYALGLSYPVVLPGSELCSTTGFLVFRLNICYILDCVLVDNVRD